jgi:hypothetical protein
LTHHGQPRELPTLSVVEAERIRERGDDARRRLRVAALLEPDEVVDADPGERGDFFAAQTGSSPTAAVWQPYVGRLDLVAPCSEELGQRAHPPSMPQEPAKHPGPVSTRIVPAFSARRRERMMPT